MHEFMSIIDVSEHLGIPVRTLYTWHETGYGPRTGKFGKRIVYRRADVDRFVRAAFGD